MSHPLRPGDPGYLRILHATAADRMLEDWTRRLDRNGSHYSVSTAGVIATRAADPSLFVLVVELSRPGVGLCLTRIELEMFPPSTPLNEAFELYLLPWMGLPFALVLVPNSPACVAGLETIASGCGLRVYDGIPLRCDSAGAPPMFCNTRQGYDAYVQFSRRGQIHWFPVHGENAWSLETAVGGRSYGAAEEEALCKAAWWEWDERHGKHAMAQERRESRD